MKISVILLFCCSIVNELESNELDDSSITAVISSIDAACDSNRFEVEVAKSLNCTIETSRFSTEFLIINLL